jgi:DNA-binding MarR family transcriptional regulator
MLSNPVLADQLRVAVGRLARRLRQQSLGGLTPSQGSVLATLDRHGPMSMGRIAEHEAISPPSVTGIVGRLADKGLLTKQADPHDLRSSIVIISPQGADLLEQRRQERTAYLAARIELLDPGDREVLAAAVPILERIHSDS